MCTICCVYFVKLTNPKATAFSDSIDRQCLRCKNCCRNYFYPYENRKEK